MRDKYIKELENKRMKDHSTYQKLINWQTTLLSGGTGNINLIQDGTDAVNEKYKAYVFIKRAGFKYENFRIELKNASDAGNDSIPDDVIDASRRLDNWRSPIVPKSKDKALQFHQSSDTVDGEQHYEKSITGDTKDKSGITCFKCNRNGHYTKECTHDSKDNGDPLNSKDVIQKHYDTRAEAKRERFKSMKAKEDSYGAGSQHFMDTKIISTDELPDFEQAIIEEDEHDGQGFMQDTMIIDLRPCVQSNRQS
jgi:hypothetical protein